MSVVADDPTQVPPVWVGVHEETHGVWGGWQEVLLPLEDIQVSVAELNHKAIPRVEGGRAESGCSG